MTSKHAQAPLLISQGIFDSVKTFQNLEQRISALIDTNTKAQGDAFEIFVEAYLATQPLQQCQETCSKSTLRPYSSLNVIDECRRLYSVLLCPLAAFRPMPACCCIQILSLVG